MMPIWILLKQVSDVVTVKKMAENYVLKNEKSMMWVYKVEACY